MTDRAAKMRERARRSYKGRERKGGGGSSVLVGLPDEVSRYEAKGGKDKNVIDIIPFIITQDWYPKLKGFTGAPTELVPGDLDYKFEIPIHGQLGMAGKEQRLCLYESFGKPCAICQDKYAELEKGRANWDKQKLRDLNPSWRTFYNIYDYNEPDEAKAYKWWSPAYNSFEKILLEQAGDDPHFFELTGGQTLEFYGRVKPIGDGEWTEPQIPELFDREPYDEGALEMTLAFDQYLHIPEPDEVTELYLGIESGEEEDRGPLGDQDRQREEQAPSRSRSRSRAPARIEDDIPFDQATESASARTRSRAKSAEPPVTTTGECPNGHIFGIDCLNKPECQACPDKYFDICAAEQKEGEKKEEPPPPPASEHRGGRQRARSAPQEETSPAAPTRTRRRR